MGFIGFTTDGDADEDVIELQTEDETDDAAGGSRLKLLFAVAALAAAAYLAYRFRSDDDGGDFTEIQLETGAPATLD